MKKLLLAVFILILLCVGAVGAFFYTFKANDYKQELAELIGSAIGHKVRLEGDIDITFYPHIGVSAERVIIENPPGFSDQPLASIGSLELKAEVVPLLLDRKLNIEKLILTGNRINLERSSAGVDNWAGTGNGSSHDDAGEGLSGFFIRKIDVSDSDVRWTDNEANKRIDITGMTLVTDEIIEGQPVPIEITASIDGVRPDFKGSVVLKTELELRKDSPVVSTRDLDLVVNMKLPSSPLERATLVMKAQGEVDVRQKTATLGAAELSVLGLFMSGELVIDDLFDSPVVSGPLKIREFDADNVLEHYRIKPLALGDPEALSRIAIEAAFESDFSSMHLSDISATIDDSRVTGSLHITPGEEVDISYALKVDTMRLQDYLPAGTEWEDIILPSDFFRETGMTGEIDIDKLEAASLQIDRFHLSSALKAGELKMVPITMFIGESPVGARIVIDFRGVPKGVAELRAENVTADSGLNPILADILGHDEISLSGVLMTEVKVDVTGASISAMRESANGMLSVSMGETILHNIDFEHETKKNVFRYAQKNGFRTRSAYVPEQRGSVDTRFDSVEASFRVDGDRLVSERLLMTSDAIEITGKGSIDLTARNIDFRPSIDRRLNSTVDIRNKLLDHPMEYLVKGPFGRPLIEFDEHLYDLRVVQLLRQQAKESKIRRSKSDSYEQFRSE